jgi:signal transduction histidine kinase
LQLATAQQITHIGSWEWNIATGVVSWSDELYRIYGLEPQSCPITFQEFIGRVHPDDRARVSEAVSNAVTDKSPFRYRERIVRPDGSIRELDSMGEASFDDAGVFSGLIGTCRDVTEESAREQIVRLYADIVTNVQIGLLVWRLQESGQPQSLRLVTFNPAAESLIGASLGGSEGRYIGDVLPALAATELPVVAAAVAEFGTSRQIEPYGAALGTGGTRAWAVRVFPLPDRSVGLAWEDITERMRAERLEEGVHRVLEMIASDTPIDQTLTALVTLIEAQSEGMMGSVLLVDAQTQQLRLGAAPNLPNGLNHEVDRFPIGPNAASCGTAVFEKRSVFVHDILTDPLWMNYRYVVEKYGLRACWSTPIFAKDGRVLGTFALYFREPRSAQEAELGLIQRVTHIAGIAIERKQMAEQLQALSAHLERVREEERTGIAREIHDELGQALTGIKMDIAWLGRRLAAPKAKEREEIRQKIRTTSDLVDHTINQVRKISAELRPGVLDDLGLLAALEWQAQDFESRTGIRCTFRSQLGETTFTRDLSTAVFRISQEALTNVARHAQATQVDVTLERLEDRLRLEILDDGKGIALEAATSTASLGLLGIRERARRLEGQVEVAPLGTRGTRVTLVVPIARAASNGEAS